MSSRRRSFATPSPRLNDVLSIGRHCFPPTEAVGTLWPDEYCREQTERALESIRDLPGVAVRDFAHTTGPGSSNTRSQIVRRRFKEDCQIMSCVAWTTPEMYVFLKEVCKSIENNQQWCIAYNEFQERMRAYSSIIFVMMAMFCSVDVFMKALGIVARDAPQPPNLQTELNSVEVLVTSLDEEGCRFELQIPNSGETPPFSEIKKTFEKLCFVESCECTTSQLMEASTMVLQDTLTRIYEHLVSCARKVDTVIYLWRGIKLENGEPPQSELFNNLTAATTCYRTAEAFALSDYSNDAARRAATRAAIIQITVERDSSVIPIKNILQSSPGLICFAEREVLLLPQENVSIERVSNESTHMERYSFAYSVRECESDGFVLVYPATCPAAP